MKVQTHQAIADQDNADTWVDAYDWS